MVNFEVKTAADRIVLNPKSKVIDNFENDNGKFTIIQNKEGNKTVMFADRDFDGMSDDIRLSIYDDMGRLVGIFVDNNLDDTTDLYARFEYNDNNSCVGFWDYDNDGEFDDYEVVKWDSENDNGRFVTLNSLDGRSSNMYIDDDFDGFADQTRKTFYNDDGTRARVYDDFDLDGKFDRTGYFQSDDTGYEAFAAWDNDADGKIDFYDQY